MARRKAVRSPFMLDGNRRKRFRRYVQSYDQGDTASNSDIAKMLQLIKEGDEKIELSDEYKSAIVVLGNSGAGKSTFVQWVAEKDDQLLSREVGKDTDEFIIEDATRISNNTVQSATIFPELVIDLKTNVAYYDCPGFSDTRSTTNDIAQTYFIKKLSGHLTSVKMLFVVSYPSVRQGVDRHSFVDLLRQSSALVQDIDKFEKSMSLVVTKVDNLTKKKGKQWVLVPDEAIIDTVADFMKQTRDWLVERSTDANVDDKERSFAQRGVKFIDIFSTKEEGNYARISLFRRPDEAGPLNKIESMIEGKKKVHGVIYDGLRYTPMQDADYGYTVSDKSKNDINALISEIDSNVWSAVSSIVERIKIHYRDSVDSASQQLKSLENDSSSVYSKTSDQSGSVANLATAAQVASSLATNVKGAAIDKLAEEMKQGITRLNIPELEKDLSSIASQGKFFKFLQAVSGAKFAAKPWEDLLKPLESYLTDLNQKMDERIHQTAQNLRTKINYKLADADKELRSYYDSRIKAVPLKKLPSQYVEGRSIIQEMDARTASSRVTAQKLLEKVKYVSSKLSVDSDALKRTSSDISKLGEGLKYLDTISGSSEFNQAPEWKSPFENLVKYIEESATWYKFLGDLSDKLSSYEQQKNKTAYGGGTITKDNFKNFLQEINNLRVAESRAVGDMAVSSHRLQELNEVLDSTVKTSVRVSCQSDTLLVEGEIVKFSDFIDERGAIKLCDSGREPKQLNIFALRKLFIDRDLIGKGKKLSVAAIAPKWETVGARRIDLSGIDGKDDLGKAAAGRGAQTGENGLPGKTGGSAGSFLGLAGEFSKSSSGRLSILANGGRGGAGQDGGDGGVGQEGETPPQYQQHYRTALWCKWDACQGLSKFKCKRSCFKQDSPTNALALDYCKLWIYGSEGKTGGSGGPGGAGGNGGLPGTVDLVIMEGKSQVYTSNEVGTRGGPGAGGRGGKGGKNGQTVHVYCEPYDPFRGNLGGEVWKIQGSSDEGRASSGAKGASGAGFSNDKEPEQPATITNAANIINNYKTYLRKNLNHQLKHYTLNRFLENLDSNDDVQKAYGTFDLIDEMRSLEEQSKTMSLDKDVLTSLYESLLDRVSKYAENPREEEKSAEYKKALTYLYTTILSKLHHMRADAEFTMVIDVEGYLDLVQSNIKTLSDMKEQSNKSKVIDKYKGEYKAEIDKKIEEADAFVKNQLKPEMDRLNEEIDGKIDDLIAEIKALIESEVEERDKIIEQKAKLERQLIVKTVFNVIDGASKVVSVMGPHGAAAGAVISGVSGLGRSLALEGIKPITVSKVTLGGMKLLGETMEGIRERKVKRLQKRLDKVSEELSADPELEDVADSVNEIKKKVEGLNDSDDIDDKVDKLKGEAKDKLSAEEKKLKDKLKKNKKITKALKKCGEILELADAGFEIYDKFKDDSKEVEEVTDSLKAVNQNIEDLKQYEDSIYKSIAPVLKQTKQDMEEIESNLGTKSQVALDVTKWQVQTSLRDIKAAMSEATEGRGVQDELSVCIEKLSEVMTTLINIYDRIQDFQNQEKLASYIADISSVKANSIGFTNQALAKAVGELEIAIRTNLMLEQYHTAVSSVKQWVFPFAHDYLTDFNAMMPSQLGIKSDDINELANKAAQHVSQTKEKVRKYKVSIQKSDEFVHHAVFDGEDVATSPFHVWRNRDHRDTISRLLAGEEISLIADVAHSAPQKDAIKFSLIEVNLRSSNQTLQSGVNEKLKHFEVSATHMGNSYYRYKDKFYVISSSSQKIEYSFSKKADGYPKDANGVYNKIRSGDIVLSPFAMWKIQLIRLKDDAESCSFDDLKVYSDAIDIELTGEGSYVSNSAKIPDFNTGDYYELRENIHVSSVDTSSGGRGVSRRRRSVPLTVTSSAGRPSSWLNVAVSFGKRLVGRLSEDYAHPMTRSIDEWNESVNLETAEADVALGIGQASSRPGPTVVEMGDALFNSTDLNGLLAWGTLLARKWSGYRPQNIRTATEDASKGIESGIRSHELVDLLMRRVDQLARSRGISTSGVTNNYRLYSDCVAVVREKIARREDADVAASLVELVGKAMLQLDSHDLGRLLSIVEVDISDLNDRWLRRQVPPAISCGGKQCALISPQTGIDLQQQMSLLDQTRNSSLLS